MSQTAAAAAPTAEPALLSIDGAIATITLNRPEAFNSVNLEIAQRLEAIAKQIVADKSLRVVVLRGAGRAFSAGGDLKTIGAASAAGTVKDVVSGMLGPYHNFIHALRTMDKIVLSSVHGSAAGAGMGLAFVADLCIAAEDAKFTSAYAKIGVSPDGGSTVGIVSTVGTRRALQLFLAEDSFSAQQAYDWGLVVKVVPAAELETATRALAQRLAQNPAAAIAGTKRLVYQAQRTETMAQLDSEEELIIASMMTDDFKTLVGKFLKK